MATNIYVAKRGIIKRQTYAFQGQYPERSVIRDFQSTPSPGQIVLKNICNIVKE